MTAELHIETLALPGLSEAEARRAARVFEARLAELLERHGLPPGVRAADLGRVDLGALPVEAATPEALGRALAEALFAEVAR